MKVLELMKALKGEILANKARTVVDGKPVILGRLHGKEWVMTPEGEKLGKALNEKASGEAKAKAEKTPAKSTKD